MTEEQPSGRRPIAQKIRFEVFKRDSFQCQYCGAKAPDVLLEIDHINPVAGGGGNEIVNLVTSCRPCNGGKGARELSDQSTLDKQRRQIEAANERRLQLEMLTQWREELNQLDEREIDAVDRRLRERTGWGINENGRDTVRRWVKKHGLAVTLAALEASIDQYIDRDADGKATDASWQKIFSYTPRIATWKAREADKPYMRDLFYIRGIIRNRMPEADQRECLALLERCYVAGATIDSMQRIAREQDEWSTMRAIFLKFLQDNEGQDGKNS